MALLSTVTFTPDPSPEEVVPVLARQELRYFHLYFRVFKQRHGKVPGSVEELIADGSYLKGASEPYRRKILRNLEYPVVADPGVEAEGPVLAIYHVAGFGDFFLTANGEVVEKRLPDYSNSSFERAQESESKLLASQLKGEANRSQPDRSEKDRTSAAAGPGR